MPKNWFVSAAALVCVLVQVVFAQNRPGEKPKAGAGTPASQPVASQPTTSQAASGPSRTAAPPKGPELSAPLKEVMRELERRGGKRVLPVSPGKQGTIEKTAFAEGTPLRDRLGRVYRVGERIEIQLSSEDGKSESKTLELLKNSWLEYLEREMESGATEVIVTGDVTAYRGKNYLLLLSYRRQVEHGNLSP